MFSIEFVELIAKAHHDLTVNTLLLKQLGHRLRYIPIDLIMILLDLLLGHFVLAGNRSAHPLKPALTFQHRNLIICIIQQCCHS